MVQKARQVGSCDLIINIINSKRKDMLLFLLLNHLRRFEEVGLTVLESIEDRRRLTLWKRTKLILETKQNNVGVLRY